MYICIHTYVYMHLCMYVCIHAYIHIHICIHTYIHTGRQRDSYAQKNVYMYAYIHTCIYIYICIHTYTQVGSGTLIRRILGLKTAFGRSCDLRSCDHAWTSNSYLKTFDGAHFRFLYRQQHGVLVIPPLHVSVATCVCVFTYILYVCI